MLPRSRVCPRAKKCRVKVLPGQSGTFTRRVPWRAGMAYATPAASLKLHREALARAVDPETASLANIMLPPRREGSAEFPQTPHLRWSLQMAFHDSFCLV